MKIPRTVFEVVDGQLVRFEGPQRPMTHRMSTEAIVEREDGTRIPIEVEAYPVKILVNPGIVQSLVATGDWTQDDLTPLGLIASEEFDAEPEEGQQFDQSTLRVVADTDGKVRFEIDQIPIPPPPTKEEQVNRLLADYGLTKEELLAQISPTEPVVEESKV